MLLGSNKSFFLKNKKKYIKIYHSYSKDIVFIEDYAFLSMQLMIYQIKQ